MRTEPLTLDHKALLDSRFLLLGLNISEYTFANIYLFREIHQFEVLFDFDIFLKGKTRDGFSYLMPTTAINKINSLKLLNLLDEVDFLFPIPQEWLFFFDPEIFRNEYSEGDSDYLFKTINMQTYPGRHLASRRNLVKQFKEQYAVQEFLLDRDHISNAQNVLKRWLESSHPDEDADYAACEEALSKFDVLGLSGMIYYIDQVPIGFILGEELNKNIYGIHFAKTNIQYKGVTPYIYQSYALHLGNRYLFINMEQDLGEPGLHKAKQAYQPSKFIKKYRVQIFK